MSTPAAETLVLLAREVAKILHVDAVEINIGIGELGVDSISIVTLLTFCEQLYSPADTEALSITQRTTLEQLDADLRALQTAC
ncbi:hypothetical protein [Burkholderia oklahomensis]|uniref:Acyl carrier protein n=1 Tax=Burkholderia oklahomensis TaxID=342113 RepID=A0AAI8FRT1_9BURK|nr:hypothetical protein [Burkholderia oklahomensis]AIO70564.1 putative acyl carrier protein [Burkholderia oklahomensis]AOI39003.1 acyl carrier protein [Burkholderia oklahomensis EO147]KUY52141.1 acyl carrier protein [Burkholderia oklahomensis EO147]QPS40649.1 acyl carrier protein [Burkholderia oklahomensis]